MIFRMLPAGYRSSQTARPGSSFSKARFFVQPNPIPILRMLGVVHVNCILLPYERPSDDINKCLLRNFIFSTRFHFVAPYFVYGGAHWYNFDIRLVPDLDIDAFALLHTPIRHLTCVLTGVEQCRLLDRQH